MELFHCTFAFGSPEPHRSYTDLSLQACEEHFNFSPLDEQDHVGVGFPDIARDVPSGFVYGRYAASLVIFRTALRLRRARFAVMFGYALSEEPVFATVGLSRLGNVTAMGLCDLAVRASIAVSHRVVDKVIV